MLDNNEFSGDNLEAEKKTRMEAEYSAEEKTNTPNLRELQTVSTAEEVVLGNIKDTPAVLDTRKKNLEKTTGGVTRKTFDTDKDSPDDEDKKSKKKKVVFKQNQVLEGEWFSNENESVNGLSVSDEISERYKLSVGDLVLLKVEDRDIETFVQSIRTINWDISLEKN